MKILVGVMTKLSFILLSIGYIDIARSHTFSAFFGIYSKEPEQFNLPPLLFFFSLPPSFPLFSPSLSFFSFFPLFYYFVISTKKLPSWATT
jgi:hypothetical protein